MFILMITLSFALLVMIVPELIGNKSRYKKYSSSDMLQKLVSLVAFPVILSEQEELSKTMITAYSVQREINLLQRT